MIRSSVVLALALLAACAGATSGPSSAPRGKPADEAPLPISSFVDSAGLYQALLTAPPVPAHISQKPLFYISYDSTGALTDVDPVSERVMAEWGRTMAGILRAHVRPQISTRRETVQTVWLVSGSAPRIASVIDLEERKPTLINGAIISRELDAASIRLQSMNPGLAGRTMTAQVRINVTPEGGVARAMVVRSSFDRQVDDAILEIARKMVFTPATVERYPVPVLVEVPVSIQFRS